MLRPLTAALAALHRAVADADGFCPDLTASFSNCVQYHEIGYSTNLHFVNANVSGVWNDVQHLQVSIAALVGAKCPALRA